MQGGEGNPDISVVSPVYGCAGCLEDLVDRIGLAMASLGRSHEIILVDDASPDGAWERIVEISSVNPAVRGFHLSRNFGQHAAISAGLEQIRGGVVVVMDCDLQDLPEEIPGLVLALEGDSQIALASRMERKDGLIKRIGSSAFYAILRRLTESDYDPTVANFGAYTRKVIDVVNAMPESDRFFPLLVRWTGFKSVIVPVNHGQRAHGRSGYSFGRLLRLALNVALSYSDKPLRMVVKSSVVFAVFALFIAGYSVYRYVIGDIQVAGFTSIIASIWLVGSVVVSCIGITGLYLGRLYNQVKGRPHFIVSDSTGGRG
ncbi:glycosyltransferase family 2 protein [Pseudoxanthomonas sacheonensis]|uniref:glycosyltransferase family 2 protein n=1 Tax=Pseudoxanthomonas sacheonensis TaxID=443615 RepID=UPI0013D53784|nr:glycosyltransferase family 2 protein [Pseudoxanthomonas sacheonensis]KAF1708597.1 glycosyltransferase [Pseudoxanthomonas sacheonensis]